MISEWQDDHLHERLRLQGADLSGADLRNANLSRADLADAYLRGTDLREANLSRALLRGADLGQAKLCRANLSSAKLREAHLSDGELRDADLRNAELNRADLSRADLRRAKLCGADLSGARLDDSNLSGADLSEADLRRVNLNGSILAGAILAGADLGSANLSHANLADANLSRASIRFVTLNNTALDRADLDNSVLASATLVACNLAGTVGLDTVHHEGPSSLGADTLGLSRGRIPINFLRGCGLSDWEVEAAKLYDPALTTGEIIDTQQRVFDLRHGSPIQFGSCFISYTTSDEPFATKLHNCLQDSGVRCWFAPEDMKIGDNIESTIDRAIQLHKKLLIVLSETSIKSEWVKREVKRAVAEEKSSSELKLFPIRIDDAVMEVDEIGWVADVRERQIGDFTPAASFDKSLERLLRDLREKQAGNID